MVLTVTWPPGGPMAVTEHHGEAARALLKADQLLFELEVVLGLVNNDPRARRARELVQSIHEEPKTVVGP